MEQLVEKRLTELLFEGSRELGLDLEEGQARLLVRYLDLLLTWNRKVNLTSVTEPERAVEMHLLDSLPAKRLLEGVGSVVDLGAGGGLPGIPLAIVLPDLQVTMVDTVGKKVGFLKAAIAGLGLKNAKAVHARAEGNPEREGIPVADCAICRAFMAPQEWVELASPYIKVGGRVLAMLGAETEVPAELPGGFRQREELEYRLPRSKAVRRVVSFSR